MKRPLRFTAVLLLAVWSAVSLRADPYAGSLYPAGVRAGETVRVVVAGQRLGGLAGAWVSGEGVVVTNIQRVPSFPVPNGKGQRAWLEKWIYSIRAGVRTMPSRAKVADADLAGWSRNPWWETMDALGDLELSLLARDLFTPRNALQMSPSLSEHAILTVVAAPDAAPGVRRLILYNARSASAPRPFLVSAEPHVAEPLYAPPPRKNAPRPATASVAPSPLTPPVVLDGQILPGETDVFRLSLKAGERLVCLVTARELTPYLGDAVPGFFNPVLALRNASGQTVAFVDDYAYLPDPVLACTVPETGVYTLEIRDNLYRGREDFVYSIVCRVGDEPLPSVAARAFAVASSSADQATVTGTLSAPDEIAEHDFTVTEPGDWSFELFARRRGSPLDGMVRLYGPLTGFFQKSGPLLATWDDVTNATFVGTIPQAECDSVGSFALTEPGRYRLTVTDRVGAGGPDYTYALAFGPTEPAFEVYATKSAYVLPPSASERLDLTLRVVRKNGFAGAITLDGGDLFRLRPATIPATNDTLNVRAIPRSPGYGPGFRDVVFRARAEVAPGRERVVRVVAADEMEQAFAYTHLVPQESLRVYFRPPDVRYAARPDWPEMPFDPFLPRRVIQRHRSFAAETNSLVQALETCARAEVVLAAPPTDDESLLRAKFATSAAAVRSRAVPVFALDSTQQCGDIPAENRRSRFEGSRRPSALAVATSSDAWSVLAGFRRAVDPTLAYADGDARRVRTFARAALLPRDADILLYVPAGGDDSLGGAVGVWARRLVRRGWSFDYVSDKTLPAAPLGRQYKTVIVPTDLGRIPEETRARLQTAADKRLVRLVSGERPPKVLKAAFHDRCRRDDLPAPVRFVRFGLEWGENWYFVFNPTSEPVSGEWAFKIRGEPRVAYQMSVSSGAVTPLKATRTKRQTTFAATLGAGEAAWFYVSAREERKK